jgi:hypothetical protein
MTRGVTTGYEEVAQASCAVGSALENNNVSMRTFLALPHRTLPDITSAAIDAGHAVIARGGAADTGGTPSGGRTIGPLTGTPVQMGPLVLSNTEQEAVNDRVHRSAERGNRISDPETAADAMISSLEAADYPNLTRKSL